MRKSSSLTVGGHLQGATTVDLICASSEQTDAPIQEGSLSQCSLCKWTMTLTITPDMQDRYKSSAAGFFWRLDKNSDKRDRTAAVQKRIFVEVGLTAPPGSAINPSSYTFLEKEDGSTGIKKENGVISILLRLADTTAGAVLKDYDSLYVTGIRADATTARSRSEDSIIMGSLAPSAQSPPRLG
jgi:hypothetical protein